MIAGAAGIELVLLVVAADEGMMPQTREHLAACELLGIRRAVVAITKIDRVERDLAELAAAEISDALRGRFEHQVVLCSAKTGEGLDVLRETIRAALRSLPAPPSDAPAHLSVDRVFSVKGAGTVVTGTLVRGRLSVGDPLRVAGERGSIDTAARGLHVHDRGVERADAPTRLAVNLAGVAVDAISRGDVLTAELGLRASARFDARLTLTKAVKDTAALEVYVGTARSAGRLQILAPKETMEDGTEVPALGRIRLEHPMPIGGGDRFVLRGGSSKGASGAVVGGGVVLDAHPPAAKDKKKRRRVLSALVAGDAGELALALVAERAPRALETKALAARFVVAPPSIVRAAEKAADRGEIVRIKDEGFVDRSALSALARAARELTAAHHAEHPLDRGIKLETLRQRLASRCGAAVAQEAIRQAAKKTIPGSPLLVEGDVARLEGFVDGGGPRAGGAVEKLHRALVAAGLKGMGEFAVTEVLEMPAKDVKPVLAKLVRDGYAIAAGGQWFDALAIKTLRQKVFDHFATNELLTIATFKEMSGLGRKQAIPLLELFDREGTSLRKGDDRLRGPALKERRVEGDGSKSSA